jgi:glycosyltransferase involved in cell wall biosynthesis
VLAGHLSRLVAWAGPVHRFTGLHHARNAELRQQLPDAIEWIECPRSTGHWLGRSLWERTTLNRLARRAQADVLFMASGTVVETCSLPQVSLAMNPWCLVPAAWTSSRDRVKAWLQRRAYRSAVSRASLMVYLSRFLRDAYVANAGCAERDYVIAPAGLHEDILAAAEPETARSRHEPNRIVCVSVMAPHKGIETVLEALALLRAGRVPAVELHLVGGWPDPRYEAIVRARIAQLGLDRCVHLHGFVSRQELLDQYARARVFCLMSWCESFGIPAVEAQCFGTPVVSSNCCAIPEVCGEGGLYPAPGDVPGTAQALARVLTTQTVWVRLSAAARANALKYTYDQTAKPLMKVFGGGPTAEGRG